jgi:hypothetical protein
LTNVPEGRLEGTSVILYPVTSPHLSQEVGP